MAADIHHRTEDFRKVYRSALADLKEVMGTAHDVLMFAASGTGAMDASVSNLFSRGDKVVVCVAGKFGERWAEIAKAYGLDATRAHRPLRPGGRARAGRSRARRRTRHPRRLRAGFGNFHRRRARRPRHGPRRLQDRRHPRGGRHHRPRHHAARYRRLGARRRHRRLAKSLHDSARPGLPVRQPQSLELRRDRHAAALLFQSEEGKEERRCRRIQLDACHLPHSGPGRSAANT